MCGDDDGFAQFYKEHFPAIFGFVLAKVNYRKEEAESLTQEIFCRVYFRICHPPAVGDLEAYLWRTARTTVWQHWKKNKNRGTVSLDTCAGGDDATAGAMLRNLIDPRDLPAEEELQEMRTRVRTAVPTLPAQERAIIELRYFDSAGRTWEEIAKCLGLSEPTVRKRYRRAIERLGKQLGHDSAG